MKKTRFFLFYLVISLFSWSCESPVEPNPDNTDDTQPEVTLTDPGAPRSSDYLYDVQTLSEIKLSVSLNDWNEFLTNYDLDTRNNVYVPATFTYSKDGDTFMIDSVGIRLRGNTSRRRPEGNGGEMHTANQTDWHHVHFQVKFDEYKNKVTFCGSDRVILKWHKDDGAYCREVYSYDLFRRFGVWTAPRATYTRMSVHVEGDDRPAYFGVYVLVEGVNDSFLKNRKEAGLFKSKNGNLWKAAWGANLSPSSMNANNMGISIATVDNNVNFIYDLKTNKKTGLTAACTQLQRFVADMNALADGSTALKNFLEERVAVDQFLRAYAVNVMVGMWDDYWYNTNNYYFYFDEDNKFYFIPFDYDNTLGTSCIMENSGTQNLLNWGSLDNDRVLMRKVMSITDYKERYKAYIKDLADSNNDYFDANKSIARITAWHQMIAPYITNDTGEDMSINDVPASWGNCSFYRVLTGNEQGGSNGNANWFKTKIKSINF